MQRLLKKGIVLFAAIVMVMMVAVQVRSVKAADEGTAQTYTITYNVNKGTLPTSAVKSYVKSDVNAVTLPTPTRAGYNFLGWSENAKTLVKVTNIPAGTEGNKTFYAFWSAKYKAKAAATYATKNAKKLYNKGKGVLCAGFVSKVISNASGGTLKHTYASKVKPLVNQLTKNGFKRYTLKRTGKYIYAKGSDGNKKIAVGDVLVFYCKKCGAHFMHAAMVTKIDSKSKLVYITDVNVKKNVRINTKTGAVYSDGKHSYTNSNRVLYLYHFE